MKLIGFSGLAGSGKDTASSFIVDKYNFTKVALADPMKRFCMEIYGFSKEQLWGESELRNQPDKRLPKPGRQAEYARLICDNVGAHVRVAQLSQKLSLKQLECDGWLTPRELLQKTAGDWGRSCYEDTWIDYGLKIAQKLLGPAINGRAYQYDDPALGLYMYSADECQPPDGVIISDCRYINEIDKLKKAGGKMIRILGGTGLKGDYAKHLSESEQKQIPDSVFDEVIINDGSIENLERKIEKAYDKLINERKTTRVII